MDRNGIDDLIAEFKDLQLRQASLQAQQASVVERISRARAAERTVATETPVARTRASYLTIQERFPAGSRVIVANTIRRPANRRVDISFDLEREKYGTVTHVTAQRVFFITDNGTKTCRSPNNLRIVAKRQTRPLQSL